jgi:predicted Rossmann fold flavoprotein
MHIAIIGGGAAGFFAAIAAKENYPQAQVGIFEKSDKLLSKVRISGGGRCNLTNGCESISQFSRAYPRGEKAMKKLLKVFSNRDTVQWFEQRGVPLVLQDDGCYFPRSQDSESIIGCLLAEARRLGVDIKLGMGASSLSRADGRMQLTFTGAERPPQTFDRVIVATGGSPMRKGLQWLADLGHEIALPVPSLFTFNIPDDPIRTLMGVAVPSAGIRLLGTKLQAEGPLLITHWGMSGPAVLILSSRAARTASELGYRFRVQVNWLNIQNAETVAELLGSIVGEHPQKQLANYRPAQLPERLWLYLLDKAELAHTKKWSELGRKSCNRLINLLTNDEYLVQGKSAFRDEFVTCGGVSLCCIDALTMQSRVFPGLYFAGEVLDIDAITGGYNLQAAWTTGYVAGQLG